MSRKGECCGKCIFWRHSPETPMNRGSRAGFCRLHPPGNLQPDGNRGFITRFPVVYEDIWCGDFKPADETTAAIHADYLEEKGCPKKWANLLRKL